MDRPQGKGKWTYPNGDVCEGYFDNGRASGRCTYMFECGDVYKGLMKHGKANGYGVKTFSDGSCYEGDFVRDFYEGQGTFSHAMSASLKRVETGNWKRGELVSGDVCFYGKGGKLLRKTSIVRIV